MNGLELLRRVSREELYTVAGKASCLNKSKQEHTIILGSELGEDISYERTARGLRVVACSWSQSLAANSVYIKIYATSSVYTSAAYALRTQLVEGAFNESGRLIEHGAGYTLRQHYTGITVKRHSTYIGLDKDSVGHRLLKLQKPFDEHRSTHRQLNFSQLLRYGATAAIASATCSTALPTKDHLP